MTEELTGRIREEVELIMDRPAEDALMGAALTSASGWRRWRPSWRAVWSTTARTSSLAVLFRRIRRKPTIVCWRRRSATRRSRRAGMAD